ncbi:hypothetical protein Leryth_016269 [Lithospermum erythrorhizon]|nr:hypothetical protein Leryth_016269 [Lithospermum erythrorhizon]
MIVWLSLKLSSCMQILLCKEGRNRKSYGFKIYLLKLEQKYQDRDTDEKKEGESEEEDEERENEEDEEYSG